MNDYLKKYLKKGDITDEGLYFYSMLNMVEKTDPSVAKLILKELESQRTHLKLIASENYSSLSVQAAAGSLFSDKYAEGFPFHRFYAGCENVDELEKEACDKAKKIFGAECAYIQPHSGADANLCAYWAILNHKVTVPKLDEIGVSNPANLTKEDWNKIRNACHSQKLLALDYSCGGHLTHGYRHNVSAQMFDVQTYTVDEKTGLLNYDAIRSKALEFRPLILLAGYSAYPGKINFKVMSEIAKEAGAVLMVDMAHFAGLVAGGVFKGEYSPFPWADVVTTTTHKTLRGPRGGAIFCKAEFEESVEKGCPLVIGGPLENNIAAKSIAFSQMLRPEYKTYAQQIVKNSKALAKRFVKNGISVLTGTSENHIVLLDVSKLGLTGRQAENSLRKCGVTLNRNAIPNDPNGPWYTSGLRLGTPALTTLGMSEKEMEEIADIISSVLKNLKVVYKTNKEGLQVKSKTDCTIDEKIENKAKDDIKKLLNKFKLYPEINID